MDIASDLDELIARLTPRQMEIARLLCEGKTGREIGAILSISSRAVKEHVYKMRHKTGAQNRIQLIVILTKWEVMRELERTNL